MLGITARAFPSFEKKKSPIYKDCHDLLESNRSHKDSQNL